MRLIWCGSAAAASLAVPADPPLCAGELVPLRWLTPGATPLLRRAVFTFFFLALVLGPRVLGARAVAAPGGGPAAVEASELYAPEAGLAPPFLPPEGSHEQRCPARKARLPLCRYSSNVVALSSYSALAASSDPPFHAAATGSSASRMVSSYSSGTSGLSSRYNLSVKPGSIVQPPTQSTFGHISACSAGGQAVTAAWIVSATPICGMPMSEGWKMASGTMKRSLASASTCSSSLLSPFSCRFRRSCAATASSDHSLTKPRVCLSPSGRTYSRRTVLRWGAFLASRRSPLMSWLTKQSFSLTSSMMRYSSIMFQARKDTSSLR
mmetsp:Transcript_26560/g.57766  ORF Transcript_26560/g.57766 Transcript_26560/m.57766 type:complete len:323 (-) Transcript_26560:886-1854(-)